MMNKLLNSLRGIRLKLLVSALVSLFIFGILLIISNKMIRSLEDQHMASRWSNKGDVSHISCFFSEDVIFTEDSLMDISYQIDSGISSAGIVSETENESARLWIYSYSGSGTLNLSRDDKTASVKAYGVGGDFFRFHPLDMVKGGYFYGQDLMQDYCILDTFTAWKLFGSNDVIGMTVDIGNIPHVIVGVYEKEEGKLLEAAGLKDPLVYVSYASLKAYGQQDGIKQYEVVMPNPIKNFAYDLIKNNIGVAEQSVEIVENNARFSILSRLKLVSSFGTRSMTSKAVIYPYWENLARGYEDIVMVLTFFMVLFVAYPSVLLIICFVSYWKRKTWTVKSVFICIVKAIITFFGFLRRKLLERRKSRNKLEDEYEEI